MNGPSPLSNQRRRGSLTGLEFRTKGGGRFKASQATVNRALETGSGLLGQGIDALREVQMAKIQAQAGQNINQRVEDANRAYDQFQPLAKQLLEAMQKPDNRGADFGAFAGKEKELAQIASNPFNLNDAARLMQQLQQAQHPQEAVDGKEKPKEKELTDEEKKELAEKEKEDAEYQQRLGILRDVWGKATAVMNQCNEASNYALGVLAQLSKQSANQLQSSLQQMGQGMGAGASPYGMGMNGASPYGMNSGWGGAVAGGTAQDEYARMQNDPNADPARLEQLRRESEAEQAQQAIQQQADQQAQIAAQQQAAQSQQMPPQMQQPPSDQSMLTQMVQNATGLQSGGMPFSQPSSQDIFRPAPTPAQQSFRVGNAMPPLQVR